MARRSIILSALTAACQPIEFSVMTFNVRCGSCDRDSPDAWENRRFDLGHFIEVEDPTIAVFQEVETFDQLQTIEWALLRHDVAYDPRTQIAVAWDPARTGPPKFVGAIELPGPPARGAILLKLPDIKTAFIGLHAGPIVPPDSGLFQAKMEGTGEILLELFAEAHGAGLRTVIAGDFNHLPLHDIDWPAEVPEHCAQKRTPLYRMLLEDRFLTDVVADNHFGEIMVTAASFDPESQPAPAYDSRIDWILGDATIDMDREDLICDEAVILDPRRPDGRPLSDHRPVVAKFRIE